MADSGESAIRLFEEQRAGIAAVILDMMMPDMSGMEVLSALQRIQPDVKVIILSGHSPEGVVQRALDAGAQAYIQKPFRQSHLLREILKILGRTAPSRGLPV